MTTLRQNNNIGSTAFPCTCGELFQGTLDGEPCLVSCPIDIFSKAVAAPDCNRDVQLSNPKVRKALNIFVPNESDIPITVETPLPVGRGYGTSTADIGAALFLASQALRIGLTDQQAAAVALQVEPTDSTFFQGLSLFDHRQGKFQLYLGEALPAKIIILDPGGIVDTQSYNQRDLRQPLASMQHEHEQAFKLLQHGITHGDLQTLSEAATLSAKAHQRILYNPLIEMALSLAKQVGAAGICRAHSGTVVGLLFPDQTDIDGAEWFIKQKLPATVETRQAALVGGGVRFEPHTEDESIQPA